MTCPATRKLSAAELLRAVEETLRPLAAELDGELHVATTPDHLVEILTVAPTRWRMIIGWPGYGDHPDALLGMGAHRIYAMIQVAEGLTLDKADVLHRGRVGLPMSMMDLIETVSKWFRALRFPSGYHLDPKGFAQEDSQWVEVEGLTTLQHQLDFVIHAALASHGQSIPVTVTL